MQVNCPSANIVIAVIESASRRHIGVRPQLHIVLSPVSRGTEETGTELRLTANNYLCVLLFDSTILLRYHPGNERFPQSEDEHSSSHPSHPRPGHQYPASRPHARCYINSTLHLGIVPSARTPASQSGSPPQPGRVHGGWLGDGGLGLGGKKPTGAGRKARCKFAVQYIHTHTYTRGMRSCGTVPGSTVVDCDSPHGFSLCPISFFLHTIHAASPFALSHLHPPAQHHRGAGSIPSQRACACP